MLVIKLSRLFGDYAKRIQDSLPRLQRPSETAYISGKNQVAEPRISGKKEDGRKSLEATLYPAKRKRLIYTVNCKSDDLQTYIGNSTSLAGVFELKKS